MTASSPHTTVLLEETINALAVPSGGIAIDCTVGGGGHTEKLLAAVGKKGQVIGLDRDEEALALAQKRLAEDAQAGRLQLIKAPFSQIQTVAEDTGLLGKVDAICADIGVSSMHLDQGERGFSLQADGPLDMRMDRGSGLTAADLLRDETEAALTLMFKNFGEEPKARQIARSIVKTRESTPIVSTLQLAALVKEAAAYRTPSRKHPATRIFQALRIAVNDELGELQALLNGAFAVLKPGGRLAIISFHSLEDRLVKNTFVDWTGRRERANVPRDLPVSEAMLQRLVTVRGRVIKPFPLTPTAAEIAKNPRARSAKLRVFAKT